MLSFSCLVTTDEGALGPSCLNKVVRQLVSLLERAKHLHEDLVFLCFLAKLIILRIPCSPLLLLRRRSSALVTADVLTTSTPTPVGFTKAFEGHCEVPVAGCEYDLNFSTCVSELLETMP